jgi:hypothetical protein
VAIKLLRAHLVHEPHQVVRFRREFRAISRIDHPGCLKVFAEGFHGAQRYIVMKYVQIGTPGRLAVVVQQPPDLREPDASREQLLDRVGPVSPLPAAGNEPARFRLERRGTQERHDPSAARMNILRSLRVARCLLSHRPGG